MMAASKLTSKRTLSSLLAGLVDVSEDQDMEVIGISLDSRNVKNGQLFIACNCEYSYGARYIDQAIKSGAGAIVTESGTRSETSIENIPVLYVKDLHLKTGIIASRFYDNPAQLMTVTGVTGTNGKTTISYIIAHALSYDSKNLCGLIGTLGYGPVNKLVHAVNTTPDPITTHKLLSQMRDQGIFQVVMEISSHGIDQHRIEGIDFDLAIFTNLSRDHLDYHGDMNDYAKTKLLFFTDYPIKKAVINIDDNLGKVILQNLNNEIEVVVYTLAGNVDDDEKKIPKVVGKIEKSTLNQMSLMLMTPWGEGVLNSNLTGKFNAYNLMASLASLCLLDVPFEEAIERLSKCKNIPGRMEKFGSESQPQVVVDYAHTPDALAQVLQLLKSQCNGKLVCVFGCGGERDVGKRPKMGAVAQQYADVVVLTNDNPRHENPREIIDGITQGIEHHGDITIELDREKAITSAIISADVKDIVLIAGKGHEQYQQIGDISYLFSDQKIVTQVLENNK
jgi:UDP-N-acetylmuramoyl-L-alanyl-D-glutamate--2,6-diaminopimelate ligase